MKIKKVRKQEMVTKFSWSTKISKSYILLLFFLAELTVSTLLIILQSLLASYQLLLYKKVYFYNLLWFASHFLLIEQIHTHIPYFYLAFSVLWSSPVEQLIKMRFYWQPLTTSYNGCHNILQGSLARFCSVSLPNQNEFNRQNKRNGHYCFCVLHRIIIKQYHT